MNSSMLVFCGRDDLNSHEIALNIPNQVYVAELAVDAAAQGDRTIVLQALLADPDELLSVHADWLPQFTQ
jgi:alpha-galactosidase/6-phospho-beta-glucosidase family protein